MVDEQNNVKQEEKDVDTSELEKKFVMVQIMKQEVALKCLVCNKTENVWRLPLQQVGKTIYVCFNCENIFIATNEQQESYEKKVSEGLKSHIPTDSQENK